MAELQPYKHLDLHDSSSLVFIIWIFTNYTQGDDTIGAFRSIKSNAPPVTRHLTHSLTLMMIYWCGSILYLYDGSILFFLQLTERAKGQYSLVARETDLWQGPARAVAHSGGIYSFFFFFFGLLLAAANNKIKNKSRTETTHPRLFGWITIIKKKEEEEKRSRAERMRPYYTIKMVSFLSTSFPRAHYFLWTNRKQRKGVCVCVCMRVRVNLQFTHLGLVSFFFISSQVLMMTAAAVPLHEPF